MDGGAGDVFAEAGFEVEFPAVHGAGDGAVLDPTDCERDLFVGAHGGGGVDPAFVFEEADTGAFEKDFFAAERREFIEAGDGLKIGKFGHACR